MLPYFSKQIWIKFLLFFVFTITYCISINAQINVLWEARYTSSNQNTDSGKEITIDNNGNVYVTGTSFTNATNGYDIVTIKYDALGNEIWSTIFNGTASALDEARDIKVDNVGNVYVTGYTASTGPNYNYVTIKYDALGSQQWATIYNGSGNGYDEAYSIAIDTLGNSYVTGSSYNSTQGNNYVTIKYNSSGVQQWATPYNGPGNSIDAATQIKLDAQLNVYVSGRSYGSGTDLDIATIKYNNSGAQQWVSRFNGTLNFFDDPEALFIDNLNNVYVAGATYGGLATENDYVTIKINSSGTQQWAKIIDGPQNEEDKAYDVLADQNQNVYVTGRSMGSGGTAENMVTIKYDASGNLLWQDTYNGPANGYDDAQQMRLGSSGALYITGYSAGIGTNNDYLTLKYDTSNGAILWEARFDGPASNSDQAFAMEIDDVESIYVTGTSNDPSTGQDFSTIKWCQLSADVGNDVQICLGDSILLNIFSPGATNFAWSPGIGLSDSLIASPFVFPTTTTTYVVSSSNALGCVDFDTILVTVNPPPPGEIIVNGPASFCIGDSATLTATFVGSYNWTPSGDTSQSITVFNPGQYTVSTVDSNGCVNSDEQIINVFNLPNVSAGNDVNICNGDSVQLSSSGANTYTWNTQNTLTDSTISNPFAYPSSTINYWVLGEDSNGCINGDTVNVTVNTSPLSVMSNSTTNDTLDLNLPNGGDIQFFSILSTNALGFIWDFGNGDTSSLPNPIYTYPSHGVFTVMLIATNGACSDTSYIDITVLQAISIEESYLEKNLSVYPNPANEYFEIDFNGLMQEKISINIYTSIGKLLDSYSYKYKNLITVKSNDYTNGLYFIAINTNKEKIIKRLTISR
jgi:hypothetical protein